MIYAVLNSLQICVRSAAERRPCITGQPKSQRWFPRGCTRARNPTLPRSSPSPLRSAQSIAVTLLRTRRAYGVARYDRLVEAHDRLADVHDAVLEQLNTTASECRQLQRRYFACCAGVARLLQLALHAPLLSLALLPSPSPLAPPLSPWLSDTPGQVSFDARMRACIMRLVFLLCWPLMAATTTTTHAYLCTGGQRSWHRCESLEEKLLYSQMGIAVPFAEASTGNTHGRFDSSAAHTRVSAAVTNNVLPSWDLRCVLTICCHSSLSLTITSQSPAAEGQHPALATGAQEAQSPATDASSLLLTPDMDLLQGVWVCGKCLFSCDVIVWWTR